MKTIRVLFTWSLAYVACRNAWEVMTLPSHTDATPVMTFAMLFLAPTVLVLLIVRLVDLVRRGTHILRMRWVQVTVVGELLALLGTVLSLLG